MRRVFDILTFVLSAAVLSGCGRDIVPDPRPASYIFFDSEVETKAGLVSDMKGRAFGVTGFEYKGEWSTVSGGEMKPNLFVEQEVTWSGSAHEYSPVKQWKGDGMKYTFFAYYPYGLTTSGDGVDGEPYVDYVFDPSEMADVMTSYKVEDVDNTYSNSVGFTMKHRLSAVDVYVSNYMADAGNDPVRLNISNLVFRPVLKHKSVSLWMDPRYKPEGASLAQGVRALSGQSVTPTFNLADDGGFVIEAEESVNLTDALDKTMIIIPQKDGMEGTVSFDFSFTDSSGNPVSVPMLGQGGQMQSVSNGSRDMAFTMNKDIQEGQRYYLHIIFINGLVTLEAAANTHWEDKDIEIEFE